MTALTALAARGSRSSLSGRLGACLLLAAGVLTMPTTHARERSDADTVTVSFGDLDLSTTHGVATLHTRLQLAAKAVCSRYDGDILLLSAYRQCFRQSLDDAVRQVNRPTLTAYHQHTLAKATPGIASTLP